MRFVDIFEQLSLIHRAAPMSTNERESITKATKIYFTDLGVRNTLVNNFDDYNLRSDRGQILENAVFMGIKRQLDYRRDTYQLGFFRSRSQSEIDIVKKVNNVQELYEIKSSAGKDKRRGNIIYITIDTAHEYLL